MTDKSSRKNLGAILVSVFIILLIVNGVWWYIGAQNKKEMLEYTQNIEEELIEKSNELDRLQADLELKIEEIKKLDGDVSDLEELKAQLQLEKERLLRSDARSKEKIAELSERLEGFAEVLKAKDEEIRHLQATNEELMSENTSLKETTNRLQDTISAIAQTNEQMRAQINVASRLRAENVRVIAVNKRGREREDEFRNRQLESLKVTFNIADNSVAPKEAKDIYIRVIEPGGNVLFDVATTSGTFTIDGRDLFYTAKKTILFDNSRQRLSFDYEKGSDYVSGEHTVEIYCDDYFIGSSTFTIL